ncbi:hypothetical protein [Cronobacter condimenti]|uniref:hypothetical protein n=1 Tax=Cronobacter condimenti TaxID=1163710 RepID=UPI001267625B|nr:hypothetical protein [Cronobacter condimenti]
MKSNTTIMACCGLFCSFLAGAATANDTPVNLNIHGQLVNVPQDICHIELSKDSMAFTNTANTLPKQGEYNSWYVTPLLISVNPGIFIISIIHVVYLLPTGIWVSKSSVFLVTQKMTRWRIQWPVILPPRG